MYPTPKGFCSALSNFQWKLAITIIIIIILEMDNGFRSHENWNNITKVHVNMKVHDH